MSAPAPAPAPALTTDASAVADTAPYSTSTLLKEINDMRLKIKIKEEKDSNDPRLPALDLQLAALMNQLVELQKKENLLLEKENLKATKLDHLENACKKAGIDVDSRILNRIRKYTILQNMLLFSSTGDQFIDVYEYATLLMGTSTKGRIIAKGKPGLSINGVFERAYSESSIFYEAYLAGSARLLKMPNKPSVAQHEFNVYSAAPNNHPGKRCLVEVTLIPLQLIATNATQKNAASSSSATLSHQLPSNAALLMKFFHSTLFNIPSNVSLLHAKLLSVAIRVSSAIDALHAGGYVHCDVKPGNIFIDASSDDCFLADYDAAVKIHQPVEQTTDAYLPAEFAALRKEKMLLASAAVDYAMLAFTLAERCGLPVPETADETATAAPRLFFNLPSFRRTLATLRSSLSAEFQRCQKMLANQHTTPPDLSLVTDMQQRCELMQQVGNIAKTVEELDSNQLKLGGGLVSEQEEKLKLASNKPSTLDRDSSSDLSNQSYHISFR